MYDQILSTPDLIAETWPRLLAAAQELLQANWVPQIRRVMIAGCGDSHHAALSTALAFSSLAATPAEPLTSLQAARYGVPFLPPVEAPHTLVIAISASGEVTRTIEVLQAAQRRGAHALALTGTAGSRLAQAADSRLDVSIAPSAFAPGVRSYRASLLGLYALALALGQRRDSLAAGFQSLQQAVANTTAQSADLIALLDAPCARLAQAFAGEPYLEFLGGGPNYGTALFSAAKILEAVGVPAIGQDLEEWAHLQYFAAPVATPVFLIAAPGRSDSRAAEIARAAHTVGRRVVFVGAPASAITGAAFAVLPLTVTIHEAFSPLLTCLAGELFAAHLADVTGEPHFRNFGGGRSVEGGGGISRIRTSEIWVEG